MAPCYIPEKEDDDNDEEEDTVTDPARRRYTLAPFSEYSDFQKH